MDNNSNNKLYFTSSLLDYKALQQLSTHIVNIGDLLQNSLLEVDRNCSVHILYILNIEK